MKKHKPKRGRAPRHPRDRRRGSEDGRRERFTMNNNIQELTPSEKERLEKLEAERKKISAEIREIKRRAYNRKYYKPHKSKETIVFETFGKTCRELTEAERKRYNAMRQAERRRKKEV